METLLNIDDQLYMWINTQLSNNLFDTVLVPFRNKLFWIPLYLVIATYIIRSYRKRAWLVFAGIGLVILLCDTISSKIIKKHVERTRPCHEMALHPVKRVPCSNGFSFTSSHATNHMGQGVFYFLLFSLFKFRWLFIIWAMVISFAQVYVGVHFPLDVVAGMILGGFLGWISYRIYLAIDYKLYTQHNTV